MRRARDRMAYVYDPNPGGTREPRVRLVPVRVHAGVPPRTRSSPGILHETNPIEEN
jgi:hypothetical protein